MVFQYGFRIKQKVLIPCEISINTNIQGSYFIYFSHSKILGCDIISEVQHQEQGYQL
jgi:hypothetical protein